MASLDSLAARLNAGRSDARGRHLVARLQASLAGPRYDAELADGVSPSLSLGLKARAVQITKLRARRKVSRALSAAIDAADSPPDRFSVRVPVDAGAILSCEKGVLALAERIATIEQPSVRGVAIARQLVFDGRSPLFQQAAANRKNSELRLASMVHAAQRALDVSPDFG